MDDAIAIEIAIGVYGARKKLLVWRIGTEAAVPLEENDDQITASNLLFPSSLQPCAIVPAASGEQKRGSLALPPSSSGQLVRDPDRDRRRPLQRSCPYRHRQVLGIQHQMLVSGPILAVAAQAGVELHLASVLAVDDRERPIWTCVVLLNIRDKAVRGQFLSGP